MKTITQCLLALAVCGPVLAQQKPNQPDKHENRMSLALTGCTDSAACKTFKQMVRAKDEDVMRANWGCFYAGHSAAEGHSAPSTDEFFLLMDGKAATMKRGVHPGIFVNVIRDGMPDGYDGFGPEHGGLVEFSQGNTKINPDGKEVFVRTYDDLGANIRWANFGFHSGKDDPSGVYRDLSSYTETLMRKSTGRFTQTTTTFATGFETIKYAGQCFRLK
jgi:hypothetical protein